MKNNGNYFDKTPYISNAYSKHNGILLRMEIIVGFYMRSEGTPKVNLLGLTTRYNFYGGENIGFDK